MISLFLVALNYRRVCITTEFLEGQLIPYFEDREVLQGMRDIRCPEQLLSDNHRFLASLPILEREGGAFERRIIILEILGSSTSNVHHFPRRHDTIDQEAAEKVEILLILVDASTKISKGWFHPERPYTLYGLLFNWKEICLYSVLILVLDTSIVNKS